MEPTPKLFILIPLEAGIDHLEQHVRRAAACAIQQLLDPTRPDVKAPVAATGSHSKPVSPPRGPSGGFTPRQLEVLTLAIQGQTNRQIAGSLNISPNTVARHIANIYAQSGVKSRAALATHALANGLVQASPDDALAKTDHVVRSDLHGMSE